jgi:hypothetical protein
VNKNQCYTTSSPVAIGYPQEVKNTFLELFFIAVMENTQEIAVIECCE